MSQVKVTLKKSMIGCTEGQKSALRALGLRKIGRNVTLKINPVLKGQINKVQHLLSVESVAEKKETS